MKKEKSKETYRVKGAHSIYCINCRDYAVSIDVPLGTTVKDYLKENNLCNVCGCAGTLRREPW